MKNLFIASILTWLHLFAQMTHQDELKNGLWLKEELLPFDEWMLSWNAARPKQGKIHLYVRLKTEEWTPWIEYAEWGAQEQRSFNTTLADAHVKVFQDAAELLDGRKATGFEVRIVAEGGAGLDELHSLHCYTNGDRQPFNETISYNGNALFLNVPGLSQMALDHERHKDLCSPTSTTAVTRYLSSDSTIDPITFAASVHDLGFNIYGNWVLNTAQAASLLGPSWNCWVERLSDFNVVIKQLERGAPTIVSIRGPLTGSALPYAQGHLLAVIGFDPALKKVHCMDPAFPTDPETIVSYDLSDFLTAWSRRGNVAYLFFKP